MSATTAHRRLAIFLNPRAATDESLASAIEAVRARGHELQVFHLSGPEEAQRLATMATQDGFDVLIAAGGDGTLNDVVNGAVAGGDAAVAVLPFGTANDFATGVGLTNLSVEEILMLAAEGPSTLIDLGVCNGRYFVNVASGGFGGEVTATTSPELKALLGGLAYTLTGLLKLLTDEQRQASIRTPAGEWAGPLLLFSLANGRLAGGGYNVAPDAWLDDGLLDLVVVPWLELFDVPNLVEGLFSEELAKEGIVRYEQTPWVDVSSHTELHVNLDGEPMRAKHFRFEVLPRRLRFFLPEQESDAPAQP